MIKKKLLIVIILLTKFNTYAQEVHGNPNIWFLNISQIELNEKWQIGNELHFRYDDYLAISQQFIVRPYLDYQIADKLVGTIGYSYLSTRPYGDYPLATNKPEHNVWEQLTIKNKLGAWNMFHRYRLEHRWSGQIISKDNGPAQIDGFSFSNRFRYRITLKRKLGSSFYLHLFDELWIKEKNMIKDVAFDRNWLYAGLGWAVNPVLSVELAYMHQYAQNNPTLFERHHTGLLTLKVQLNK